MADDAPIPASGISSLAGKRLYPPGLLAAYTLLVNLPLGLVLYGLNIRTRGQHRYGGIMWGSGILVGVWLIVAIHSSSPPQQWRGGLHLVALLCALSIYKRESGPYETARAAGAVKARWWPPLLITIGIMGSLYFFLKHTL